MVLKIIYNLKSVKCDFHLYPAVIYSDFAKLIPKYVSRFYSKIIHIYVRLSEQQY